MAEAIVVGLVLAVLLWIAKSTYNHFIMRHRRNILENWLRMSTRDEPGESHKHISEVAQHLGLSTEEVNNLVFRSNELFRSQSNPHLISIWREEPQSVYEKRGILMI